MGNLKQKAKFVFSEYGIENVWFDTDESDFKIRDNDLYFYDPFWMTNIALGRHGDGWVCIFENFVEA